MIKTIMINMSYSFPLIQVLNPYVFLPNSLPGQLTVDFVGASAVPFVVLPLSNVLPPIWPRVCALSVFLVSPVVALVLAPIGPVVHSVPVLFIVEPLSLVLLLIWPLAHSKALYPTVQPVALVYLTSCVVVCSLSVSFPSLEHPFVLVAVTVCLHS